MFLFTFSVIFFDLTKHYKKFSKLLYILLIILIVSQFYHFYSIFPTFYEPTDEIISDIFEPNSNILIAASSNYTYDSVFAFTLAKHDRDFRVRYFRYCSATSIDRIKDNGIKYVIIAEPHPETYDKFVNLIYNNSNLFEKIKEYKFDSQKFLVFEYKDFQSSLKKCNFICLTNETICTEYDKPIEVL